jgi:hypothetical protein
MGGAGKKIGGGRGMLTCTLTPAIAETGAKTTNVKNNILKIDFFIGLPSLFIFIFILSHVEHSYRCQLFDI